MNAVPSVLVLARDKDFRSHISLPASVYSTMDDLPNYPSRSARRVPRPPNPFVSLEDDEDVAFDTAPEYSSTVESTKAPFPDHDFMNSSSPSYSTAPLRGPSPETDRRLHIPDNQSSPEPSPDTDDEPRTPADDAQIHLQLARELRKTLGCPFDPSTGTGAFDAARLGDLDEQLLRFPKDSFSDLCWAEAVRDDDVEVQHRAEVTVPKLQPAPKRRIKRKPVASELDIEVGTTQYSNSPPSTRIGSPLVFSDLTTPRSASISLRSPGGESVGPPAKHAKSMNLPYTRPLYAESSPAMVVRSSARKSSRISKPLPDVPPLPRVSSPLSHSRLPYAHNHAAQSTATLASPWYGTGLSNPRDSVHFFPAVPRQRSSSTASRFKRKKAKPIGSPTEPVPPMPHTATGTTFASVGYGVGSGVGYTPPPPQPDPSSPTVATFKSKRSTPLRIISNAVGSLGLAARRRTKSTPSQR
ncbi:hypothetical protein CONPUDRAFT_165947 [Coniophora puteana RWD-64-598 SS2]|uniref:Uncharacterized protein n=1 Tax=Coniophora puteana (strain RWD-64-598) TaxID=741705 RepID=A0A5M3MP51_CONPW|nr:uncharacterized protein CONPUDRAFT_165947 [Coniophora puteana RWD-64-598 SS2]EIW80421.1 hypothetical protein CONPUDRAFT_165947 [Coniophora puteana RWD-64-598 SS2]